ncbi:MAG: 30S ribosomal protein S5 [Clostridia bacterium]|nr:30S ribosomal protein S5 [Clostridia bacterium]
MENVENVEVVATEVAEKAAPQQTQEQPRRYNREGGRNNDRKGAKRNNRDRDNREDDGLIKKLVAVNRVTKVVKGGRTMRFSALCVVGDGKGMVGIGMAKAAEVPQAIEKANLRAKKAMVKIALVDTTIPHEAIGKFGRGKVLLMPAQPGTGVIAGGPVRNVLEAVGIKDIRTKSYGSNNPINCVKATFDGLTQLRTREHIAELRGKSPDEI